MLYVGRFVTSLVRFFRSIARPVVLSQLVLVVAEGLSDCPFPGRRSGGGSGGGMEMESWGAVRTAAAGCPSSKALPSS